MCLLCVELQKNKMTPVEVAQAFREVAEDHLVEAAEEIEKRGPDFSLDVINALHEIELNGQKS